MQKRNYEVEVLVNGHPVREYFNQGKTYIEGRKGVRFSLKIKNNGWNKILAIPSIDGLSVMDGLEASYDSSGYVINGYDSITIDGWRTSEREVAEFYFTDPEDSYSKRSNKKDNLGVIGVAVFREKESTYWIDMSVPKIRQWPKPPEPGWPEPIWLRSVDDGAGTITYDSTDATADLSVGPGISVSNCSVMCSQDLGTGFGDYKPSEVTTVNFEKESYPDAVFKIYYNTRRNLERLGIDFRSKPRYVTPEAFPGRYCKPPRR